MMLSDEVVCRAFKQYHESYVAPRRQTLKDSIEPWQEASQAFEHERFDQFEKLYGRLKGKWQAFRGAQNHWCAKTAYKKLSQLDKRLRRMRLSGVTINEIEDLWTTISSVAAIKRNKATKRNKHGSSLVAISKFLHFWNPRLFIVVDRAWMWDRALQRAWLSPPIHAARTEIEERRPALVKHIPPTYSHHAGWYLPILLWAGQLARENPNVTERFYEFVSAEASTSTLPDLRYYEAAAVEWFLLGVVELPPQGVRLERS